jgi:hypothetical protein
MIPLTTPQLSIGTLFGTSVELRYLPSVQLKSDLGKFKYFGIGIQHNPSVWFDNPLPVDISVGFYTETLDVGSEFSSKGTVFGLNVGKTFGPAALSITPYAGFELESSTITVNYNQTFDTQTGSETVNISFDESGENTSRFTLGASVRLSIINLNVDYSFAKFNTLSAGLGFIFQ